MRAQGYKKEVKKGDFSPYETANAEASPAISLTFTGAIKSGMKKGGFRSEAPKARRAYQPSPTGWDFGGKGHEG
jgi:hypothetical protein